MSNSVGNDSKSVRKWLRSIGVPPTAGNVERIGKEVRRSESENRRVEQQAKETGRGGTYDMRGRDAHKVAERTVRRELRGRPERR